ncbi:MAG: hypothetical protein CSA65_09585 [Proteobacteria bacterium]|nr:MAG: hypothetical protein CSB49_01425 [Pseudomonadota bacterium]PIE17177.1 MAG: hypothetical protein CSA65_09585 [Pseudomonadota bacterium]
MPIREQEGALRFEILVAPRASRARLGPVVDGRLKVAVTAPPVDGEANAAVTKLVAKRLGVGKGAVRIVRGERGKKKLLEVVGVTPQQLLALLR